MRIFLTGGTGYIGSAVLDTLARGGHQVHALVRHRAGAARVQQRGAQPVIGDLSQPATYRDAAAAADGTIHTAFESSARGPAVDATALETLVQATDGPGRFFIYTSATWVLGSQPIPADESAVLNPAPHVSWRPQHEQRVLASAANGLRTAVIRPGIVYGSSRGLVCDLLRDAANGLVRTVGAGDNHWALVYDRDLGELYLRIAANPTASGIFHATDHGDERVNDLVTAIASHVALTPSVRRMPLDEARKKIGSVADALVLDQIVRSMRARHLGWRPSLHSVAGNVARLIEEWRRGKEAA